jgi:leader peptidase (prepilin peptidase)/N-methyltransferase
LPSLADFPQTFLFAFLVPFGLAWGSFLNVLIHRLPRGESVVRPASRCPGCGKSIRPYDNVPILSYLILRGRARCCGAPISPRYPLVELLGGLLAVAVLELLVFELPLSTSIARALGIFLVYFTLGLTLIALCFIDLEYMILPDSLTLGGAAIGLVTAHFRGVDFQTSLLGAALGFAIIFLPFDLGHRLLRGYPGMGLGDAKLTLLAGAWFGWRGAVFALFGGAVQATLTTLIVYAVRGRIEEPDAVVREREALLKQIAQAEGDERVALERERDLDPVMQAPESGLGKMRIPFGPFLALATLEYALFEPALLGSVFEALLNPSL